MRWGQLPAPIGGMAVAVPFGGEFVCLMAVPVEQGSKVFFEGAFCVLSMRLGVVSLNMVITGPQPYKAVGVQVADGAIWSVYECLPGRVSG